MYTQNMQIMKKIFLILSLFSLSLFARADEGMWMLTMLQQLQIEQKGSKLTPEQIYSINSSSLKDAIVGLGDKDRPFRFFCSAELVSGKGLVFTNYHCAFEMIQKHASISNDYIKHGFWAKNQSEELPAEGITASIVAQIIDVSDQIMPLYAIPGLSWREIQDTVAKVQRAIVESVQDTSSLKANVSAFFERNQYFLFLYEVFEDVRIVGAPPKSIGKYGGDTDNWMWPRQTGDFCVLRIYGNSENKPAEFSLQNEPITPRHFLPISLQGFTEGDFVKVLGFPGSTNRYKTSFGIDQIHRHGNTSIIIIGDVMLEVYRHFMNKSQEISIKYQPRYYSMSNYWKYAIGQNRGIEMLDVRTQKMQQEKELIEWILEDSARKERYGMVFPGLEEYYRTTGEVRYVWNLMNIGLLNSAEFIIFVYEWLEFYHVIQTNDRIEIELARRSMEERLQEFFKDYDAEVDKAQFIAMMQLFYHHAHQSLHPAYFNKALRGRKGSFSRFADEVFSKSMFVNETKMRAFLNNPSQKVFENDPAFEILQQSLQVYFSLQGMLRNDLGDELRHRYVEAVLTHNPDSLFYPDANSTLRYTYGYVGGYYPRDAVHYNYYTTINGVFQKENPNDEEFIVPKKLSELYAAKDFDGYTNSKGELPVNFITNNDITGGNSGSAVMNAQGELIGIAFDGNWESMSGDIIFEYDYQRCIAVDIRYVLFIIDKFAGASYLFEEMNIIR